ncbi:unnamed protein product [Peniophora sp. CBMAI 1063]|nr:unnamed protein product [Peniophora sp. CBMAI 1063]
MAHIAKWTYLGCRISVLILALSIIAAALPGERSCLIVIKFLTVSDSLGVVAASTLLSIRVGAVWKWEKKVVAVIMTMWLTIFALVLYFSIEVGSVYDQTLQQCTFSALHRGIVPAIATLVGDLLLLALLFFGLQSKWRYARQFTLWQMLWNQGLLYLFLAAVIELPVVVMLSLDINAVLNSVLLTPEVFVLGIGATRMYRSLNSTNRGGGSNAEHFTNGTSLKTERSPPVQLQATLPERSKVGSRLASANLEPIVRSTPSEVALTDPALIPDAYPSLNGARPLLAEHRPQG